MLFRSTCSFRRALRNRIRQRQRSPGNARLYTCVRSAYDNSNNYCLPRQLFTRRQYAVAQGHSRKTGHSSRHFTIYHCIRRLLLLYEQNKINHKPLSVRRGVLLYRKNCRRAEISARRHVTYQYCNLLFCIFDGAGFTDYVDFDLTGIFKFGLNLLCDILG